MTIICRSCSCIYNFDCKCRYAEHEAGEMLTIGKYGKCDCYESYRNNEDYQSIFFKACRQGKDYKGFFKAIEHGKRAEINGFVVYYKEKILAPGTWCTEERSGVGAPYKDFCDADNVPSIRRKIESLPYKNVRDLPFEDNGKISSAVGAMNGI